MANGTFYHQLSLSGEVVILTSMTTDTNFLDDDRTNNTPNNEPAVGTSEIERISSGDDLPSKITVSPKSSKQKKTTLTTKKNKTKCRPNVKSSSTTTTTTTTSTTKSVNGSSSPTSPSSYVRLNLKCCQETHNAVLGIRFGIAQQ